MNIGKDIRKASRELADLQKELVDFGKSVQHADRKTAEFGKTSTQTKEAVSKLTKEMSHLGEEHREVSHAVAELIDLYEQRRVREEGLSWAIHNTGKEVKSITESFARYAYALRDIEKYVETQRSVVSDMIASFNALHTQGHLQTMQRNTDLGHSFERVLSPAMEEFGGSVLFSVRRVTQASMGIEKFTSHQVNMLEALRSITSTNPQAVAPTPSASSTPQASPPPSANSRVVPERRASWAGRGTLASSLPKQRRASSATTGLSLQSTPIASPPPSANSRVVPERRASWAGRGTLASSLPKQRRASSATTGLSLQSTPIASPPPSASSISSPRGITGFSTTAEIHMEGSQRALARSQSSASPTASRSTDPRGTSSRSTLRPREGGAVGVEDQEILPAPLDQAITSATLDQVPAPQGGERLSDLQEQEYTRIARKTSKFVRNGFATYKKQEATVRAEADNLVSIDALVSEVEEEKTKKSFEKGLATAGDVVGAVSQIANGMAAVSTELKNVLVGESEHVVANLNTRRDIYDEQMGIKIEMAQQAGEDTTALEERAQAEKEAIDQKVATEEAAAKKKAFQIDKYTRLTQSIMNTATAIVSALGAPFPASLFQVIVAGAMGATQIGVIASQPAPPGLAAGGIVPAQGELGGLYRLGDKNKAETVIPFDVRDMPTSAATTLVMVNIAHAKVYGENGADEIAEQVYTGIEQERAIGAISE